MRLRCALWPDFGVWFVSLALLSPPSSVVDILLARVRYQTFFAQERARLDRAQRVLDIPDTNRGRIFSVASHLLYQIPAARAQELERLYLDNLVYMHAWADFVQRSRNEWKEHLPLVCPIPSRNVFRFR